MPTITLDKKLERKMNDIRRQMKYLCLEEHENNNGHTIFKHIGKSFKFLEDRCRKSKYLDVASSFRNVDEAVYYIQQTVLHDGEQSNLREFAEWMLDYSNFDDYELYLEFDEEVGYAYKKTNRKTGDGVIVPCHEVSVVMRKFCYKGRNSGMGFKIISAYPQILD